MPEQKPIPVTIVGDFAKTNRLFRQFFPKATPEQVARAAGVVDGMRATITNFGDSLKVVGTHPDGESKVATYYHPVDSPTGEQHLHQEISWNVFGKQFRGQGHQRFADQLEALDKLPQVKKISVPDAAGMAGSRMFNGYYTWPRYGFNAPLTEEHRSQLSPELNAQLGEGADFHKLYSHPNGPAEWKANGKAITDMEFDPAPNSEHRKRFAEYHAKRTQQEPTGTGTPVRNPLPEVPPTAPQQAADPYRTADQAEKVATALRVSDRKQVRGATVLKYNAEAEAHPTVKGFQLEHALRRAISDPEATSDLKTLAHSLLTGGTENSGAAYGINDEVQSLPEDHWLRKAGYNWLAVPHKLHLDAAVGHIANSVVGMNMSGNMGGNVPTTPLWAPTVVWSAIRHRPEDFREESAFGKAAEGLQVLADQGHSWKDIEDSTNRHRIRVQREEDLRLGHTTPKDQERLAATVPESGSISDAERYAAKGKNPEGGLTVAEARRQGIQPGSRTKAEAEKAGGFSKIEGKTQKRRKSFCARACGQAKQFPKAAKDPESRLRKALRIWGCRCASKNAAEEQAEKYAKERPNYSPLISHAAAVLDNPDLGAVGAFADHLAEHYPDHPLTQALHQWINGAAAKDTLLLHLKDKTPHQVVGPWAESAGGLKPVVMGVVPSDRYNIPEEHRAFQKFSGNSHWTEVFPMTAGGAFSRVPKSRRKVSSAEVAQHLFDTGGLPSLVYGVVGAQYWHPERQAEREAGTRQRALTFYKAEKVKYQSPALSEFITAVRQIRSDNQEVRRKIAEEQYKRLGLEVKVRDAIADWPHSASANTAHSIDHNGDLDKVRAGAALYGIQTNSPQLLLFHEHPEGTDLLHKFDVQGSAEKLRQQLDAAGLPERTLSPTSTGWSVFFFDPKGQLQPKLSAFTQQAGYNLETSVGTGERIGDGQQAEADRGNRADYRKFIRQYEKQQGIQ